MAKTPPLKLQSAQPLVCAAALVALCLFAGPAWSITIDAGSVIPGADIAHLPGATVAADGGTFATSSFNGVPGFFGVQTGAVPDEIDIFEESIVITFDHPHLITLLEIGRLFAIGNFDDEVNEVARVVAQGPGGEWVGLLTVTSPFSASWTGSPSVPTNLSRGDEKGAGLWEILDPFGQHPITSLTFSAEELAGIDPQDLGQNSDFALRTVVASPIPEPVTAGLLGLGLVGLGVLGRRGRG